MVRRAKEAGLRVTAEACPHHLFLTDEAVEALGTHAKMAPPLRTASDVEAVRQGLRDGIIDILATDHAPHAPHEKDQPFEMAPDGIIGLETLLPLGLRLVSEGVLDLATFVDRAVMAPRRVLGLAPTSPAAGEPADFAVVDAGRAWTYRADEGCSRSRNTPFDGWSFAGRAVLTVVAGVVRWDLDGRAAAAGVPVRQGVA
jgi:dihydroorotase